MRTMGGTVNGARRRGLVGDDGETVAHRGSSALRFDGFETLTADSGSRALAAVAEHEPELVVLDVMLGDLDGGEGLRRLRPSGSSVRVVFLTARDAGEHRVEGLRAGADDYVVKPFSVEELLA